MYASWQEIVYSHFIEEMVSNLYSRGTCWRVWCKSQRHRATVLSLDYSDFCDFLLFRILIQSKPSWSLGWLKWASPCCPSFHHSWIPMIQKSRYDPSAVLEWIAQMFLPHVCLFEITTFSACNPESSCRKLIFKMVSVGIGTCVSTVISTSSEKWKQSHSYASRMGIFK